MSKKHFNQYREPLFVNRSEHILSVKLGSDGETYAICFHPNDVAGHFPVRFTHDGHSKVTVRFHDTLQKAFEFIDQRIEENQKAAS